LYGAPGEIRKPLPNAKNAKGGPSTMARLGRNFLHAAELELKHPRTGEKIARKAALPAELTVFVDTITAGDGSTKGVS
jgi:23S rRNA-/tRNA-specific pseudouridylate synthase